jgi:glycosyltransferase involved in cell wall biosynthesis
MRVALITPGITPYVMGGMQRHSFNLARGLARLGVEVDLYHTDFGAGRGIDGLEGMEEDEKARINSVAIAWPEGDRLPGHYLRQLKRFSARCLEIHRNRRPVDFIIAKSLTGWAFVEARRRGDALPPIGVNYHGFEMYQPQASPKMWLAARMMRPSFGGHIRRADYVFSYGGRITALVRERLRIRQERIIEIPGGVDAGWLAPEVSAVDGPRRVLFLGRYERRKGIEELNQVILSKPKWMNRAHFRFVGPIPEERRLDAAHVSYAGALSDRERILDELRRADVLVCPSHAEGMPNVILEAMASGLAVVATDVGAVAELVDESNGRLITRAVPACIERGLADVMGLGDDELLAMKRASLERARRFSWDEIARRTLAELRDRLGTADG